MIALSPFKWKEDQLHFDLLYTVAVITENGVWNIVIRGWCVWMKMEGKEEFQYIINEIKNLPRNQGQL